MLVVFATVVGLLGFAALILEFVLVEVDDSSFELSCFVEPIAALSVLASVDVDAGAKATGDALLATWLSVELSTISLPLLNIVIVAAPIVATEFAALMLMVEVFVVLLVTCIEELRFVETKFDVTEASAVVLVVASTDAGTGSTGTGTTGGIGTGLMSKFAGM